MNLFAMFAHITKTCYLKVIDIAKMDSCGLNGSNAE